VLQGTCSSKHVEPGDKPGITRIEPGTRCDLGTAQTYAISRLGSDQDGLRHLQIRRVLGDTVDSDQHRRQKDEVGIQPLVCHESFPLAVVLAEIHSARQV
jgi:hypothetical protein